MGTMETMDGATAVACLCGAVKLQLRGLPLLCAYCHCDDCQAVHGAAYLPAAIYRADQVQLLAGSPRRWARRTTQRVFCGDCGTRLYAEPDGLGIRSVMALLLPAGLFTPTLHMQCQHAVLPVMDDLPHLRDYPRQLGGSDVRMPW